LLLPSAQLHLPLQEQLALGFRPVRQVASVAAVPRFHQRTPRQRLL
jgi:hypothetical protein